jgi:hypothetical protein
VSLCGSAQGIYVILSYRYHIDIIISIWYMLYYHIFFNHNRYGYHISFIDIIINIWWFPEMGVPQWKIHDNPNL